MTTELEKLIAGWRALWAEVQVPGCRPLHTGELVDTAVTLFPALIGCAEALMSVPRGDLTTDQDAALSALEKAGKESGL